MNIKKLATFILLISITGYAIAQTVENYVHRTSDGKSMTVFYVLPPVVNRETRVLFTMHGASRTAEGYARQFRPVAVAANVAIIAPLYDRETFGNGGYDLLNFGSSSRPNPYDVWAFHYLDGVFNEFTARHRISARNYILYGFSAGGQFAHRTYFLSRSPYLDYVIAGGSGFYTFPDETRNFPEGIRNLMEYKETVLNNLRNRKLYIVVGADDNDPNDPQISSERNHQGIHRVERAINFFEAGKNYARQNNINLNWEFKLMDTGDHAPGPTIPYVLDILTRNTRPTTLTTSSNLSGQERIYGTWYSDSNSVYLISNSTLTYISSSSTSRFVVRINSFTSVTNDDSATNSNYPNGFRIRGVYTEADDSSRPVGSNFDYRFFPARDSRSMVRRGSNNVWNRY